MKKGFVVWLTGLPCSGKTSIAKSLQQELGSRGHHGEMLDGDVLRQRLSKGLGFSKEDRLINIDRVAFVASLLERSGAAVVVSLVSPYRQMREQARGQIGRFFEVYVKCPLEVCEKRDVKGMYRQAREGKIKQFTGVDDVYEEPLKPELIVETDRSNLEDCVKKILSLLEAQDLLLPANPFPDNAFLSAAFSLAARHHEGQKRKGGGPYITHPVGVSLALKNAGFSEDVIAAGLLHDVLEDTGCEIEEIGKKTSPAVAAIVAEVTDKDKTAPWAQRKQMVLSAIEKMSPEALAVVCADKTHNLKSLVVGLASDPAFAKQFSSKWEEKIENYSHIFKVLQKRLKHSGLLSAYQDALNQLTSHATRR